MVTLGQAWRAGKEFLAKAGIEDAAFDARELCRACCKADPLSVPQRTLTECEQLRLQQLYTRRAQHEPLQYLLGEWDFLDFTVAVGPGVLIPRADTECVAQASMDALRCAAAQNSHVAAMDLCAGTGILAIAMARCVPAARVTAIEKNDAAFEYLKRNCAQLAPEVSAVQADVFGYEHKLDEESLDVIVSNPPYVTCDEYKTLAPELHFEPREALCAEQQGLAFYRHIAPAYFSKLRAGGMLVFEIGAAQSKDVCELCRLAGYVQVSVQCDAAGLPRCVCAHRP